MQFISSSLRSSRNEECDSNAGRLNTEETQGYPTSRCGSVAQVPRVSDYKFMRYGRLLTEPSKVDHDDIFDSVPDEKPNLKLRLGFFPTFEEKESIEIIPPSSKQLSQRKVDVEELSLSKSSHLPHEAYSTSLVNRDRVLRITSNRSVKSSRTWFTIKGFSINNNSSFKSRSGRRPSKNDTQENCHIDSIIDYESAIAKNPALRAYVDKKRQENQGESPLVSPRKPTMIKVGLLNQSMNRPAALVPIRARPTKVL